MPDTPPKSPAELAKQAADYKLSDFVFDGSMEGDFDKAYPAFVEFSKGLMQAGVIARALEEFVIEPIKTTIPIHKEILKNPLFRRGQIYTDFIPRLLGDWPDKNTEIEEQKGGV